jgi:uncharacterized protein YjbI with pentapeptide repeats
LALEAERLVEPDEDKLSKLTVTLHLRDRDLSRGEFASSDFRKADLSGANLSNAYLRNADLRNAHLIEADLSNAKLILAKLGDADLGVPQATVSRAELRGGVAAYAVIRRALEDGGAVFHDGWSVSLVGEADASPALAQQSFSSAMPIVLAEVAPPKADSTDPRLVDGARPQRGGVVCEAAAVPERTDCDTAQTGMCAEDSDICYDEFVCTALE